jgi:hemolysin activation/secretion protein
MEGQLRLLRLDPLFENVSATLQAAGCAESRLQINVIEADPFRYGFEINNFSPPSVGSERFGISVSHLNLTGGGDRAFASYYRSSTGGLNSFDLGYQVFLNPIGGTLNFGFTHTETEVTEAPFDELGVRGESDRYHVSWRQPFVRTPREEFALSFGFTHKSGQTFVFDRLPTPFGFGPDDDGFSSTSVFHFGQQYISRQSTGAWALSSQFNFGTELFSATTNPDPIPDGQFFSWIGQIQRVQLLGLDHQLILQADIQLTPDSLLPSESFVIGGGQSVRGFRQSARSGDNGVRFFIEDRITLERDGAGRPIFLIAPFADLGAVWNHPDNPNTLPRQNFLAGVGLALIFQDAAGLEGLDIRFDYAFPLIELDDRGENFQDHSFYFSINYSND